MHYKAIVSQFLEAFLIEGPLSTVHCKARVCLSVDDKSTKMFADRKDLMHLVMHKASCWCIWRAPFVNAILCPLVGVH